MFCHKRNVVVNKAFSVVFLLISLLLALQVNAQEYQPLGRLEVEPPFVARGCFSNLTSNNNKLITACIESDDPYTYDFPVSVNIFAKDEYEQLVQQYKINIPSIRSARPASESQVIVKADGEWVVVALLQARNYFHMDGMVYLYKQAPDGTTYELFDILDKEYDIGYRKTEGFGVAIDIQQDMLLIKSAIENTDKGPKSYVYDYRFDGEMWQLQQKIELMEQPSVSSMKQNIVIEGNSLFVSSTNRNQFDGTGEIHIFDYDENVNEWMFKQAVSAPFDMGGGYFGQNFAVKDNTLIALVTDVEQTVYPGSLFRGQLAVFEKPEPYAHWEQQAEIISPQLYVQMDPNENFGSSIWLSENELLVGAPAAEHLNGTVYKFDLIPATNEWAFAEEVRPDNMSYVYEFGASIAKSDDGTLIVGAPGKNFWQQSREQYSGYGYVFAGLAGLDSDGDGIPDQWEMENGMDPNYTEDANYDFDGDGLNNLEEYKAGTEPHNPDTDGDSMSDRWEVDNGLNPLVNDALNDPDGDGVSNVDESVAGTDPNNPDDYPQVLFKKLPVNEAEISEYQVCAISANGEKVYGKEEYGSGHIWEDGVYKSDAPGHYQCSQIADDGRIALENEIAVPGEYIDGYYHYDFIPYPSGFRADYEGKISADGRVVAGSYNGNAAIWDGEQIIEVLAETGREYQYSTITGLSGDGSVAVIEAHYDDNGQMVPGSYKWVKGQGVTALSCEQEKHCTGLGISHDASTIIGEVFDYQTNKSYGVWWDANGRQHNIPLQYDNDDYFSPRAVSDYGAIIIGVLKNRYGEDHEAYIFDKRQGYAMPMHQWLMDKEYELNAPVGDFHSWQLTSATGISADGTVLVGYGDYYGNKNGWMVTINLKDSDNDGMPDQWEMDNGLDPYKADADIDFDFDGLTNLQEYQAGTDPQNQDTDGDQIPDKWEVENGLNPVDYEDRYGDPDLDGISNEEEFRLGTDPYVNDYNSDDDGDGVVNIDEVNVGTNPNDPDDYPQVLFKKLPVNEAEISEYEVCSISANGEKVLGIEERGSGHIWEGGIYKSDAPAHPYPGCSQIADDGRIALENEIAVPGEYIDGYYHYDFIPYPSGFRADYEGKISADGRVVAGSYNGNAAIWDGEQIIEVLAETGREYQYSTITGLSGDGSVAVIEAHYDDNGQMVPGSYKWVKGQGVTALSCEQEKHCTGLGISHDASTIIGEVFDYQTNKSYGVWWDANGYQYKIPFEHDNGEFFRPRAVSDNGAIIVGSLNNGYGHDYGNNDHEAYIFEKGLGYAMTMRDWLMDLEYELNGSVTDFYSWDLSSAVGISADGTVIVGNGGHYGNKSGWMITINHKDTDNDGMPDLWEMKHGLDPYTADAGVDFDFDGLTNLHEYQAGTDPQEQDTDGDSMSDRWEVDNGLNPLVNDALIDLDGDGVSNVDESVAGTDPNNPDDYPQVLFKKLPVNEAEISEYQVCAISANGEKVYGKEEYGSGHIWEDGVYKSDAPGHYQCSQIADDGRIALENEIAVPGEYIDGYYHYDFIPYPSGFRADYEGKISADGRVVAGSYNGNAAIWDGEQIIEVLAETGREYLYNRITGLSGDGSVAVIEADYDDNGQMVPGSYKWVKGQGITELSCEQEKRCSAFGISNDASIIIGEVYDYQANKSYGVWWDANGRQHNIPLQYDNDDYFSPRAVSDYGAIIIGVLKNRYGEDHEAYIFEKRLGYAMPMHQWLMDKEYELNAPVGDFHSWQLTSAAGISADGTVIVGNGDYYGKKSGWMITINYKDTDNDGMPDQWEMENGLDPYTADADIDFDFDGLTNLQEYQSGTDPQNQDTDGDQIPDKWEVDYGLNPVDYRDGHEDKDEDGLWNIDEYHFSTNPINHDTDEDGLMDGAEVHEEHTDPLNPDTDADNLKDGVEVNQYHTDPRNVDTDGDEFWDGVEIELGMDPLMHNIPGDFDNDGKVGYYDRGFINRAIGQKVLQPVDPRDLNRDGVISRSDVYELYSFFRRR